MHVGQDAVDENRGHRRFAERGHRLLTGAYAHGLERYGQEAANPVIVLDDEHSRRTSFDHRGWIITGTPERHVRSVHTFHRPVTVRDLRWAQSLVL